MLGKEKFTKGITMENERCPICGGGTLKEEIIVETFVYKEYELSVPNYKIFSCDVCGESIVDVKTSNKVGKILRNFKDSIDTHEH